MGIVTLLHGSSEEHQASQPSELLSKYWDIDRGTIESQVRGESSINVGERSLFQPYGISLGGSCPRQPLGP